jgi:hypothetical protein
VPDLGRRYVRGELPQPFNRLLSASRTVFHPDNQDLVYFRDPREGLAFLFSVGIDSIFHKQIDPVSGLYFGESQLPHTDKRNQNSTEPIENIFATFCSRSGWS